MLGHRIDESAVLVSSFYSTRSDFSTYCLEKGRPVEDREICVDYTKVPLCISQAVRSVWQLRLLNSCIHIQGRLKEGLVRLVI